MTTSFACWISAARMRPDHDRPLAGAVAAGRGERREGAVFGAHLPDVACSDRLIGGLGRADRWRAGSAPTRSDASRPSLRRAPACPTAGGESHEGGVEVEVGGGPLG